MESIREIQRMEIPMTVLIKLIAAFCLLSFVVIAVAVAEAHPRVNDDVPEEEGWLDAMGGAKFTDNPYPMGSKEARSWRRGWRKFNRDVSQNRSARGAQPGISQDN